MPLFSPPPRDAFRLFTYIVIDIFTGAERNESRFSLLPLQGMIFTWRGTAELFPSYSVRARDSVIFFLSSSSSRGSILILLSFTQSMVRGHAFLSSYILSLNKAFHTKGNYHRHMKLPFFTHDIRDFHFHFPPRQIYFLFILHARGWRDHKHDDQKNGREVVIDNASRMPLFHIYLSSLPRAFRYFTERRLFSLLLYDTPRRQAGHKHCFSTTAIFITLDVMRWGFLKICIMRWYFPPI